MGELPTTAASVRDSSTRRSCIHSSAQLGRCVLDANATGTPRSASVESARRAPSKRRSVSPLEARMPPSPSSIDTHGGPLRKRGRAQSVQSRSQTTRVGSGVGRHESIMSFRCQLRVHAVARAGKHCRNWASLDESTFTLKCHFGSTTTGPGHRGGRRLRSARPTVRIRWPENSMFAYMKHTGPSSARELMRPAKKGPGHRTRAPVELAEVCSTSVRALLVLGAWAGLAQPASPRHWSWQSPRAQTGDRLLCSRWVRRQAALEPLAPERQVVGRGRPFEAVARAVVPPARLGRCHLGRCHLGRCHLGRCHLGRCHLEARLGRCHRSPLA